MLVCAFVVPVSGSDKTKRTNSYVHKHPLLEFSQKYRLIDNGIHSFKNKSSEQARLESVEHQALFESDFFTYQKIDHIYQAGRRSEIRYSYRWDDESSLEITSREVFQYENDLLVSAVTQNSTGQSYENDYRTLYTYQVSGGETYLYETIDQVWNEGISDWENDERVSLILSNGKINIGETSIWIDDDWSAYELFFLEEQGDDLYVTYQESYGPNGQNWRNTERQIFENFSIIEMYLLFTEEMNIMETGSFLTLAELLPDYTEQVWDGNEWLDVSRQVTNTWYDIWDGQINLKIISGEVFDGEWKPFSDVRIAYQDGKPHEMVWYSAEESETEELIPVLGEEYEFNEEEQLSFVYQKHPVEESFKASDGTELITVGRLILQWSGTSTSIGVDVKPVVFSLGNAYPNPFNPSTVIPFEVGNASHITIKVYDMLGRYVSTLASDIYSSGSHSVRFDGSGLASGVYLVRLDAPGLQQTRRISLLK